MLNAPAVASVVSVPPRRWRCGKLCIISLAF